MYLKRIVGFGPLLICCLLGLFMFAGISCRGVASEPTEARLKSRVETYLKARIDRNLEEMRKVYKNPGEARLGNIYYLDSEIVGVTIDRENKQAVVALENSFKVMGFTFQKVKQKTNWVWSDGDWWLVVPKISTPFGGAQKKGIAGGHGETTK
jgi:hypothetical protein